MEMPITFAVFDSLRRLRRMRASPGPALFQREGYRRQAVLLQARILLFGPAVPGGERLRKHDQVLHFPYFRLPTYLLHCIAAMAPSAQAVTTWRRGVTRTSPAA